MSEFIPPEVPPLPNDFFAGLGELFPDRVEELAKKWELGDEAAIGWVLYKFMTEPISEELLDDFIEREDLAGLKKLRHQKRHLAPALHEAWLKTQQVKPPLKLRERKLLERALNEDGFGTGWDLYD